MSLFYFHSGQDEMALDRVGTELDGADQAYDEAIEVAGQTLKDLGRNGWKSDRPWRMIVTDEGGQWVCELRFSAERHGPASPT